MYLTTNGNEFCGVYRFVVVNFQGEKGFLTEREFAGGGGCVFVQQKCRIVAELGIEHTSSFLMGFLCPTCGKLAFATIILFVLHFGIRPKRNFIHFKRMSYGIIACLVNYKFE